MEANEILVLDEGKIIERGLHEDLVKTGGWYAQMWQMQQIESHLTFHLKKKAIELIIARSR